MLHAVGKPHRQQIGRYTYGVYNEEGAFAVNPDDMVAYPALGNKPENGA